MFESKDKSNLVNDRLNDVIWMYRQLDVKYTPFKENSISPSALKRIMH